MSEVGSMLEFFCEHGHDKIVTAMFGTPGLIQMEHLNEVNPDILRFAFMQSVIENGEFTWLEEVVPIYAEFIDRIQQRREQNTNEEQISEAEYTKDQNRYRHVLKDIIRQSVCAFIQLVPPDMAGASAALDRLLPPPPSSPTRILTYQQDEVRTALREELLLILESLEDFVSKSQPNNSNLGHPLPPYAMKYLRRHPIDQFRVDFLDTLVKMKVTFTHIFPRTPKIPGMRKAITTPSDSPENQLSPTNKLPVLHPAAPNSPELIDEDEEDTDNDANIGPMEQRSLDPSKRRVSAAAETTRVLGMIEFTKKRKKTDI
eukprot:TRINITY_DN9834_c0_g1_i2.p1 TRINITY_DN9834_c0_g1~~TRINITY_DN9834_c0_g1_i2.p1  ORF type:complete len:316 (+),score=48.14 TRINITY_DN9834_c0_g1_i2:152-1099(+)